MEKHSNQNTHHNEAKKSAHDLQIVRPKANLKLSHGVPATDKHQAPNHRLKLYVRAVIESEALSTVKQLKRKP